MSVSRIMIIVMAALMLSACDTMLFQQDHASQDLASGIKSYEDGNYTAAMDFLQDALKDGLHSKSQQVLAYKYMAFIECVSGREKQCRDAFRKALEINPYFVLKPAEAGHPVWGPVFRGVKEKSTK